MKYNININQLVLSDTQLDLIDCAILDWLITFCNSSNQKIQDKRKNGMTWIDYGQLLKDMPLLRIKSKGALTPRFKKIEDSGYISVKLDVGSKVYIALTDKVDELFFAPSVHENEQNRSPKRTVTVHENETTIILDNNYTKNIYSHEEYLIKIPDTELTELSQKYNCDRTQVLAKGDQLYHWLQSNGKKKYKNFRSLLMGALSRDYGLRQKANNAMMI